jgi:cytochrome bd-type quinol oxidase subunit 1
MNVEQSCCGRPKWTTDSILVATQQSKVGMNDYYHNMNPPLLLFYYYIIHVFLGCFFFFLGYVLFENWLSSNQKTKSWCQQNTNRVGPIKHILIIHPSIHPSIYAYQPKKKPL